MSQQLTNEYGLDDFAAQGKRLPQDRRRSLEAQLPLGGNDRFDSGLFTGLAVALKLAQQSEGNLEDILRELASVVAAHVIWQRAAYERLGKEYDTPEARAAMDAEIEGLRSGRIPGVEIGVVLQQLEEIVKNTPPDQCNGLPQAQE